MIADALQRFHLEKLFPIHHESFGTDLKVPIAPHFKLRRTMQEKYETERMASPYEENWEMTLGEYIEYSNTSITPEAQRLLLSPDTLAKGDELLMIHLIKEKLGKSSSPLKIVDVGGAYGVSWVRIAKHFEKEIHEKKIEMIVTNLRFDPDLHTENLMYIHKEHVPIMRDEDYIFWQENRHLVSFINCRVQNLPDDIDIIYENDSVTYHSYTPALNRLQMLSKLKKGGCFITKDPRHSKASIYDNRNNNLHIDDIITADILNFNQAVQKSLSFKSERDITIQDKQFPLISSAQIITKVG